MLLPLNVLRKIGGFDRGRMDSADVTQKGENPRLCHAWIALWRAVATAPLIGRRERRPQEGIEDEDEIPWRFAANIWSLFYR